MGVVVQLFVAPRHGAPMRALAQVEAIADCGLRGDRYAEAGSRKSDDYQLTLIEAENIEAYNKETGLPMAPEDTRRNIVTRGVDLNALCGQRFAVGGVVLEGLELCEPCATFGRRTHAAAVRFFVHRGGLRCRILRGGPIQVGDPVSARGEKST